MDEHNTIMVLDQDNEVVKQISDPIQLSLRSVGSLYEAENDDGKKLLAFKVTKGRSFVDESECSIVYLKIARCCPKLQDLTIANSYGAYSANVIPMIRSLSELRKLKYCNFDH